MSPRDKEGTNRMNDKDRGLAGAIDRVIRVDRTDIGGLGQRAFRTPSNAMSAVQISPVGSPSPYRRWGPRLTTGWSWVRQDFVPPRRVSSSRSQAKAQPQPEDPSRPKGPPWFHGHVLDGSPDQKFAKLIRSSLSCLDAVTGKDVLLDAIGNPTEGGEWYKRLRDPRLKAKDEKDAGAFFRERRRGVPAAFIRQREELHLRDLLGIDLDHWRCIAFNTYPACATPALLEIPWAWTKTEYARTMLVEGLIGFFKAAGIDQLARECKTVDELLPKFEVLINGYVARHMEAKLREEPALSSPPDADDGRAGKPSRAQKSFPTPSGTRWQEVIVWVEDLGLTVQAKHLKRKFTFEEAGFCDRRKRGGPDLPWVLLKAFATNGGAIPFNGPELPHKIRTNLKQHVWVLRQRLRNLIPGIDDDPAPYVKDELGYRMSLKIATSEGLLFPVPDGVTQWTNVTIAHLRPGAIRVSVPTTERYGADTYVEGPEGGVHRLEAAERESELALDYDLRMIGLAGENGRPNAAGEALIKMLRADGVVSRPADDNAMLHLCGVLSELMAGISGSPFRFAPSSEKWIALFQTSCELP